MLIKLSKEDEHKAQLLGADTVKICEMQKFDPRLDNSKQSREEANICGFKGEFAICRLFNLSEPTFNVLTDGGIDLWFDGISIDVKWTGMKQPAVIFDNLDKFRAKVAILVVSTDDPRVMDVKGYVTKDKFAEKSVNFNYGHGDRLKMDASEITPIEQFWRHMMERRLSSEWRER